MKSQAALDGVRVNGLRWRHTINGVRMHSKIVGELGDKIKDGDAGPETLESFKTAIRAMMVPIGRFFDRHTDLFDSDTADAIEECEGFQFWGDPAERVDDVRYSLTQIYDWADYHRVLMK